MRGETVKKNQEVQVTLEKSGEWGVDGGGDLGEAG